MAKEFADNFYHSRVWRKCKASYIAQRVAIDGGLCEVCHERPGYIVHHKIWLTERNIDNPEITLNFSNLRFECKRCHDMEEEPGGEKIPNMPRYYFTPEGDVEPLPPLEYDD